jgi:hypothetical protein
MPLTDRLMIWLAPPVRPFRVILVAALPFWVWLTAYNISIAQANLLGGTPVQYIASPQSRAVQHLLLFGLVLLCYRWAWRIGWPERGRLGAFFAQLGIALAFASLARFALNVGLFVLPAPWVDREADLTLMKSWGAREWIILEYPFWRRAALEFFFNYAFGLTLIVGLRMFLELRHEKLRAAKLREDWLRARLDALAGQLNPHFLFNSLNTVASFVRSDPDRAERLVADLSQLMRATLRERERPYASVAEELEFIERYLQIERTRFEDRLSTAIEADGPVLNARLPSLLLQPLAENAIKHGVSRARGPVRIGIGVRREGERLIVEVRNTFRPLEGEPEPDGTHVGLRNVRERLETLYGADHGFQAGPEGEEWVVRVSLPFGDRGREEEA